MSGSISSAEPTAGDIKAFVSQIGGVPADVAQTVKAAIEKCFRERNYNVTLLQLWNGFVGVYNRYLDCIHYNLDYPSAWIDLKNLTSDVLRAFPPTASEIKAIVLEFGGVTAEEAQKANVARINAEIDRCFTRGNDNEMLRGHWHEFVVVYINYRLRHSSAAHNSFWNFLNDITDRAERVPSGYNS
ncbi:hypothetical protein ACCS93_38165 [Rhizobium ruizarguesonis]